MAVMVVDVFDAPSCTPIAPMIAPMIPLHVADTIVMMTPLQDNE